MHPRRADYRLSAALIRAIRNSPLSLNAIGWPHGIAQPRMSAFIKGQPFSAATREKFRR